MGIKKRKPKPELEVAYVAPPPRKKLSTGETVPIVLRHMVPLSCVLLFSAPAEDFLLLSMFGLAFTVTCIACVGVAVSVIGHKQTISRADEIAAWITLVAVGMCISLFLTMMFGWVLVLMTYWSKEGLWNSALGWSALAIVVFSIPELVIQYREDVKSNLSEAQRKYRDQPKIWAHIFCAGLLFILSGYAGNGELFGALTMSFAVTAIFLFRDLRPDLLDKIARRSDLPPQ